MARLALFGASPDTNNLGVTALFLSAAREISKYLENVELIVFDNGLGVREDKIQVDSETVLNFLRFGARGGRRYYRSENLLNMMIASRFAKIGSRFNPGVRLIDSCDAVLDLSGGDSFSDIYGVDRFTNVIRPKHVAINRDKPLILLPQTYGPFKSSRSRVEASTIIRNASMAWARDEPSFEILKQLVGSEFDSDRYLSGVDLAFSLSKTDATECIGNRIESWIEETDRGAPLIGLNVSGLIYNSASGGTGHYGFKTNYRKIVYEVLKRFLDETEVRVILLPHVAEDFGHFESDLEACENLLKKFSPEHKGRVCVAPSGLDPQQTKWLVSRMDWFCGTRMHSTIAALSSGIPTATISYSDKSLGVFQTCGQSSHVLDPRMLDSSEITRCLLSAYRERKSTKASLQAQLPALFQNHDRQMSLIANHVASFI